MMSNQKSGAPTTPRHSSEEKAAAVQMVRALLAELGIENMTDQQVATQLVYGVRSVSTWVT